MASSIKAIDRKSVHRICSGQVVLNLAVAVKELLENSLDAGATSVNIRLKEYGSELLEVTDNATGVHPDNFQALTLKHHTSKLSDFSDLESIGTFGFRGEALSSLCALSKVTIATRHVSQDIGSKLEFDHTGAINLQTPVPRQVGTTVSLVNLFCTLPVRQKEFHRNLKKEFNKMTQLLNAYCLVSTGVKITCTNQTSKGSKATFVSTPGCSTVRQNISSVFGPKQLSNLIELKTVLPSDDELEELKIDKEVADMFRIEGFISSCSHGGGRQSSDRQFYYINSRPCEPSKVMKAVNEVYHQYNVNQVPFVYMNISVDKTSVDVNVTPDKRQIFLDQEKLLIATVKASLREIYEKIPSTYLVSSIKRPLSLTSDKQTSDKPSLSKFSQFRHKSHSDNDSPADTNVVQKAKQMKLDDHFSIKSSVIEAAEENEIDSRTNKSLGCVPSNVINNEELIIHDKKQIDALEKTKSTEDKMEINEITNKELMKNYDIPIKIGGQMENIKNTNIINRELMETDENLVGRCEKQNYEHLKTKQSSCGNVMETCDELASEIVINDDIRSNNREAIRTDDDQRIRKEVRSDDEIIRKDELMSDDNRIRTDEEHIIWNEREVRTGDDEIIRNGEENRIRTDKEYRIRNEEERIRTDEELRIRNEGEIETNDDERMKNEDEIYPDEERIRTDEEQRIGNEGKIKTNDDERMKNEEQRIGMHEEIRTDDDQMTDEGEIVTDEVRSGDDVARTVVWVEFGLDLLVERCKRRDRQRDTGVEIKFRANIDASKNREAEVELSREITKDMFYQMEIVGQFNVGFIITMLGSDLFIVDQHATDEKYNFETLQRTSTLSNQQLVLPQHLDLTAANECLLLDNMDVFKKNGFDFVIDENEVVSRRVKLSAIPMSNNWVFGKEDIDELLFMLQDVTAGTMCRPSRVRSMFASRACRMSVMIGTYLSFKDMRRLIDHMAQIEQPWNCPHGRPTMRHLINLSLT